MSSSLVTSATEHVCTPHIICSRHAWCPGHYLSASVLPLLKATHHICLFSHTHTIRLHRLAVDFHWCFTHHTQKLKHTSQFKVCHGSRRPSIFNLIYLCHPLTAVPVRHAVTLFFETSLCTSQREKTQNMVQGTHPQQGVQMG
jgi:hypothetical protein